VTLNVADSLKMVLGLSLVTRTTHCSEPMVADGKPWYGYVPVFDAPLNIMMYCTEPLEVILRTSSITRDDG
jgi:hypothetical protein